MLDVNAARVLVLSDARPLPVERVPLAAALGRVLALPVTSDLDSPPYDKSVVDGYALRATDLSSGEATFEILEEVVAGSVPTCAVGPGQTTRIMTGAPIPDGADCVVMVERAEPLPSAAQNPAHVRLRDAGVQPGQNILRRGAAFQRGDQVLENSQRLRPAHIGLLAEVGGCQVPVFRQPTIAIVATGNELVPPDAIPQPGQIRNSNSAMLAALARDAGALPHDLGIARDDPALLAASLAEGLKYDVLLVSGGVSAGVLDLVPGVLADLGVEQRFHKVRLKPGKPTWYGVRQAGVDDHATLVFGLPGNPVSSFVCFELFVRPALSVLQGQPAGEFHLEPAILAGPFRHRGDRPTYHPARWTCMDGQRYASTVKWQGSADLRGLAQATALIHFPAGDRLYQRGDEVELLSLYPG